MDNTFMHSEREIAEMIFEKFRSARCKENEIVPMRTIRFTLLNTLNPKDVENFVKVCNGLIALRYINYAPDGLERLILTRKGYDYIYDGNKVSRMLNIPWIIPDSEKTDWNKAYSDLQSVLPDINLSEEERTQFESYVKIQESLEESIINN